MAKNELDEHGKAVYSDSVAASMTVLKDCQARICVLELIKDHFEEKHDDESILIAVKSTAYALASLCVIAVPNEKLELARPLYEAACRAGLDVFSIIKDKHYN